MISTYSHTKQKINAQNADPQMWGLDLEDIETVSYTHLDVYKRQAVQAGKGSWRFHRVSEE